MLALAALQFIYEIISIISIPLGGIVDELPFGMQEPVDFLASVIHTAFDTIPLIEEPFTFLIYAIEIKIALVMLGFAMWIIERIK